MKHPGEMIAQLRQDAGLTQEELADAAAMARGTLASIETGARPLRAEQAQRIAPVLGIPWPDLWDRLNPAS